MSTGPAKISPLRKPVECPNCNQPSSRDTYPFCSKRCSEVDLNRWFAGAYAIGSGEDIDDFNEPEIDK